MHLPLSWQIPDAASTDIVVVNLTNSQTNEQSIVGTVQCSAVTRQQRSMISDSVWFLVSSVVVAIPRHTMGSPACFHD